MKSLAESCSRQLRAWADSLQNSDIKGQRHLNEQSRATYDQQRRADVFWQRIEAQHQRRVEQWTKQMNAPKPGEKELENES